MLHYAQIQLRYDTQELSRKGKVVKGVTRLRYGEYRARRITLQSDWIMQRRSRQLLPGRAQEIETNTPHDWLVGQSSLVTRRDSVLVARTLCQQSQAQKMIPFEVYNPTDQPE